MIQHPDYASPPEHIDTDINIETLLNDKDNLLKLLRKDVDIYDS